MLEMSRPYSEIDRWSMVEETLALETKNDKRSMVRPPSRRTEGLKKTETNWINKVQDRKKWYTLREVYIVQWIPKVG